MYSCDRISHLFTTAYPGVSSSAAAAAASAVGVSLLLDPCGVLSATVADVLVADVSVVVAVDIICGYRRMFDVFAVFGEIHWHNSKGKGSS